MIKRIAAFFKGNLFLLVILVFIAGIAATLGSNKLIEATSTDKSCEKCHVHPHVFDSWKLSKHYDTRVGTRIHCVECHLPPKGQGYLKEKIKVSARDLFGYVFKDSAAFNWEAKATLEGARRHVFNESCISCHPNLFPLTLTKKGQDAHLYYTQKQKEILCINCHLDAGHYNPNAIQAQNVDFGKKGDENKVIFTSPASITKHEDFVETIPNTTVSFTMKAIPGGSFKIGSPENEQFRKPDEGPVKGIKLSPFFMAETEVSWKEFLAFYKATAGQGRSTDTEGSRLATELDAISGPTPPYGQPDQNWGMGSRPAITMTFHAAETYCKWLSQATGKTYRLPTETEWEYACRGGKQSPYFFEGNPKDFSGKGFLKKLFGKTNEIINKYIIFKENSQGKTQESGKVEPNPFGLKNMLGNAAEYCSDWYSPETYSKLSNGAINPKGPESGKEHVVRGGSFNSEPGEVRSASRDFTRTEEWLKTDPQMPKSIWWLSDCNYISFRVVCEFDNRTGNQ
jgi:sulfatase modifying factor 1